MAPGHLVSLVSYKYRIIKLASQTARKLEVGSEKWEVAGANGSYPGRHFDEGEISFDLPVRRPEKNRTANFSFHDPCFCFLSQFFCV